MIGEINLLSGPFNEDVLQTLKSSCTKLLQYLDHPKQENIIEGR